MTPRSPALSAALSLGWGAPIRAIYEVSKVCGGHRLVFGALARRHLSGAVAMSPFAVPATAAVPASAQARCLQEAEEISRRRELCVFSAEPSQAGKSQTGTRSLMRQLPAGR